VFFGSFPGRRAGRNPANALHLFGFSESSGSAGL